MSHRIDFVWHAPEVYKVKFDGETVCTLYKTDEAHWQPLSSARKRERLPVMSRKPMS